MSGKSPDASIHSAKEKHQNANCRIPRRKLQKSPKIRLRNLRKTTVKAKPERKKICKIDCNYIKYNQSCRDDVLSQMKPVQNPTPRFKTNKRFFNHSFIISKYLYHVFAELSSNSGVLQSHYTLFTAERLFRFQEEKNLFLIEKYVIIQFSSE